MRRALAIDEKSFGPDHPSVAIRLNNLAILLKATSRLAEAEPLDAARARYIHGEPWAGSSQYEDSRRKLQDTAGRNRGSEAVKENANFVMAGLDPAIHIRSERLEFFMDGRIKCGHDYKRERQRLREAMEAAKAG